MDTTTDFPGELQSQLTVEGACGNNAVPPGLNLRSRLSQGLRLGLMNPAPSGLGFANFNPSRLSRIQIHALLPSIQFHANRRRMFQRPTSGDLKAARHKM